jgi:putative acetyltransferase
MDGRGQEPDVEVRAQVVSQYPGEGPELTVRPEQSRDAAAIHELVRQAFGRDLEANLVDILRSRGAYLPELALVAVRGEVVTGYVMVTRQPIVTDHGEEMISTILGPLAVQPDHQNLGIGSLLTTAAIERAPRLGFGSMVLIGHPTYYPRFGFRPASTWGLRFAQPIRDDVFMALELKPGALVAAAGTVTLLPAFDEPS